jgi:hypothetical protein
MGPGQSVDEEGNSLVYLTATNSAPHSAEVVVIYNRNRFEPSVSFGIYDWGTPKEWKWRDYRQFQLGERLCYQNIAKRIQGNTWRNIVRVKVDGRYRTIFSSEYQQTEYARTWWGPISEEFPPGASADMPSANWSWTLSIDGKEWRK